MDSPRKSCLANMITFCDKTTGLVSEWKSVGIAYLDFRKAFDTVSCKILMEKLTNYGLHELTVRWAENWMNSRVQGMK